jgi:tetratricopeptide (TPR) repeat protein
MFARAVEHVSDKIKQVRRAELRTSYFEPLLIGLPAGAPRMVTELFTTFSRRDWETCDRLGSAALDFPMPEEAKASVMHMVGVSMIQLGRFEEGMLMLQKVCVVSQTPALRAHVFANLAGCYSMLSEFHRAYEAADKALAIEPGKFLAHYNGMCAASRGHDLVQLLQRAEAFVRAHPDVDDPDSERGKAVLADKAFEYLRQNETFKKLFPGLARVTKPTGRRSRALAVTVLTAILSVMPSFAHSEAFGCPVIIHADSSPLGPGSSGTVMPMALEGFGK